MPRQKLVYVVDDDPGMLRALKRLLSEHGYDSVLFSTSGAFQRHEQFDDAVCVILDIDLNDGSGIDVRRRLAAAGISLPVIFITGKDSQATRAAAHALGVSCLSHQAVLRENPDRAGRARFRGHRLAGIIHRSRAQTSVLALPGEPRRTVREVWW